MYYVLWPLLKTNTRTLLLSKIQLEEFGWFLFIFCITEQALKNKSLNIFVVVGKLSGQQFQANIPLLLVKGWHSVSGKIVGISHFCLKTINSCFNQTQLKVKYSFRNFVASTKFVKSTNKPRDTECCVSNRYWSENQQKLTWEKLTPQADALEDNTCKKSGIS